MSKNVLYLFIANFLVNLILLHLINRDYYIKEKHDILNYLNYLSYCWEVMGMAGLMCLFTVPLYLFAPILLVILAPLLIYEFCNRYISIQNGTIYVRRIDWSSFKKQLYELIKKFYQLSIY